MQQLGQALTRQRIWAESLTLNARETSSDKTRFKTLVELFRTASFQCLALTGGAEAMASDTIGTWSPVSDIDKASTATVRSCYNALQNTDTLSLQPIAARCQAEKFEQFCGIG